MQSEEWDGYRVRSSICIVIQHKLCRHHAAKSVLQGLHAQDHVANRCRLTNRCGYSRSDKRAPQNRGGDQRKSMHCSHTFAKGTNAGIIFADSATS